MKVPDKERVSKLVYRTEQFLKVFKFYGKDKNNCTLFCKEVAKNESDEILEDILTIGKHLFKNNIVNIRYWYKDKGWTVIDNYFYKLYCQVACNDFGINNVDPMNFSGACIPLVEKIFHQFGSNDFDCDLVITAYIRQVIKHSLGWNKTLVYSPKSLLNGYGWNVWQSYIDNTGLSRFITDTQYKEISDKVKNAHKEYFDAKANALKNNDIVMYNKILTAMSELIQ